MRTTVWEVPPPPLCMFCESPCLSLYARVLKCASYSRVSSALCHSDLHQFTYTRSFPSSLSSLKPAAPANPLFKERETELKCLECTGRKKGCSRLMRWCAGIDERRCGTVLCKLLHPVLNAFDNPCPWPRSHKAQSNNVACCSFEQHKWREEPLLTRRACFLFQPD